MASFCATTEPNYASLSPAEIEQLAWGDERELFQQCW
jgi:hypothetical protein